MKKAPVLRARLLQFSLARLMHVVTAFALFFAIAKWWGVAYAVAISATAVAVAALRWGRIGPMIVLLCYAASYVCLVRPDPQGGYYYYDYQQKAANYRVCDPLCQVIYRPAEVIDRDIRPNLWRFA